MCGRISASARPRHGNRPESPGCDSKRMVKWGIPYKEAFSVKRSLVLPVTSPLSILLASFHLVDDIVYGSERDVASNLLIVAILAVWLYGALMLPEGRAGHIIMLIGSLLGLTVFWSHLTGPAGPPWHRGRQIEWSLFLRLDAPRARGCFSVVARAFSAWSMESAALEGAIMTRSERAVRFRCLAKSAARRSKGQSFRWSDLFSLCALNP